MQSIPLVTLALVLSTAGCRYAGPLVEVETEVRVVWTSAASTTAYRGGREPGHFEFESFAGSATSLATGGTRWGLDATPQDQASRPVAQPLGTAQAVLAVAEAGATLTFVGGATCALEFVSGTWADFTAGRDVVLRLSKPAWDQWMSASQTAFLSHVDRLRQKVEAGFEQGEEVTEAGVVDFVLEEDPLIRANRTRLLVFFEPLRIEGGFNVIERRRARARGWRFAEYELSPGTEQVLASLATVIAQVAVEVGTHLVFCARGVGRACAH